MLELSRRYHDYFEEYEEELRTESWQRAEVCINTLYYLLCLYSRDQERVREQRAILDKKRKELRQQCLADNQRTVQQRMLELRSSSHDLLIAEQEA